GRGSGHGAAITYFNTADMHQFTVAHANSVDMCTVFMTLHHLEHPMHTIRQLRRVLRVGGGLVIREHDCKKNDVKFANFLNAIHIYNCDYLACKYMSADEWISLITRMGFR